MTPASIAAAKYAVKHVPFVADESVGQLQEANERKRLEHAYLAGWADRGKADATS
jgi:hypothetical protein